jgi:hypothetical protein
VIHIQPSQPLSEGGTARGCAFAGKCGELLEDYGPPTNHTSIWVVTLTSNMSDFGSQRIQGLPLPTHAIQRHLDYGVPCRASEHSVPSSLMTRSLRSGEFAPVLMGYGLVPSITSAILCFAFFMMLLRIESCRTGILLYVRKDFHDHYPHRTDRFAIVFCRAT